jgi:hypothetical protein
MFTAMLVLPTLLTIFTIPASLEIAGRIGEAPACWAG